MLEMRGIVLCAFLALVAVVSAQTVLVLTSENFEEAIGGGHKVLVKFYAPWY